MSAEQDVTRFRLSGTLWAESLDEAIALVTVLERLGWKGLDGIEPW